MILLPSRGPLKNMSISLLSHFAACDQNIDVVCGRTQFPRAGSNLYQRSFVFKKGYSYEGKAVIGACQNAPRRPIGRTQPRWLGCDILDFFAETPRKRPTAITLPKNVPETSGWTQKTRLGILYNLCAKSGAKLFFRRSYGDSRVFDLTTHHN